MAWKRVLTKKRRNKIYGFMSANHNRLASNPFTRKAYNTKGYARYRHRRGLKS